MSKATVTVEGFVAVQPEVTTTQTGKRVAKVSIAHTPQKKDGNGGWVDAGPTTWFEAAFWDDRADAVAEQVRKGDIVILSGTPEANAFQRSNGEAGAKVVVQFATLGKVVRPQAGGSRSVPDSWPVPGAPAVEAAGWGEVAEPGSYDSDAPF